MCSVCIAGKRAGGQASKRVGGQAGGCPPTGILFYRNAFLDVPVIHFFYRVRLRHMLVIGYISGLVFDIYG